MAPTVAFPPEFCFLNDQAPLSPEGFERAVRMREAVRELIHSRESYIRHAQLDPEIHLPGANWALGEGLHAVFETVLNGDYTVINNLRLFSQIYSGHQLLSLSGCDGTPLPDCVPSDADEQLKSIVAARNPALGQYVARYRQLVPLLPDWCRIGPPRTLGEVGWLVDGQIVNHDTNAYLERVLLLAQCGQLERLRGPAPELQPPAAQLLQPASARILEIGSGYGGLAFYLRKIVPSARYYLVDIPESLLISSMYLSILFPELDNVLITPGNLADLGRAMAGFTFVPNYLFDQCVSHPLPADLVINTLSMSEMTSAQVRYYCHGIARLLAGRGVFFEQNRDTRCRGLLDAKRIVRDCLPWCLPLKAPSISLQQGDAHLWAAVPVAPYRWRPSADVTFRERGVGRLFIDSLRKFRQFATGNRA